MHANSSEKGSDLTSAPSCFVLNEITWWLCPNVRTDGHFGPLKFETLHFLLVVLTPWSSHQVFYPHLLLTGPHICFLFCFSLSLHPSKDQKVAGVALTPTYEVHTGWSHSLSTTHPLLLFTRPQHQTRVAFFFKDKRHGVISVPVTSAHSYWFLVFFPLLVYVESVVCLCSASAGGFVSLCLNKTSNRGQRDAWCLGRDRDGYFLLSYAVADFGHCFSFSPPLWKTS